MSRHELSLGHDNELPRRYILYIIYMYRGKLVVDLLTTVLFCGRHIFIALHKTIKHPSGLAFEHRLNARLFADAEPTDLLHRARETLYSLT